MLSPVDYAVIFAFLLVSLGFGLLWSRRSGESMNDFFLSGRRLPWWLAGVSMAATNFSIDSPLATTKYVAQQGIAGVWIFWSSAICGLSAAFFFARLWRRADVVTDAEVIELRYSGRAAAALRLFKGLYFGLFLNCYVLGWVIKAVVKTAAGVADLPVLPVLAVTVLVALIYTVASGLTGVVWTDLFQYCIAVGGSMLLASYTLAEVGGVGGLLSALGERFGAAEPVVRFIPAWGEAARALGDPRYEMTVMPASAFVIYLLVQWWANKYSDGGGKHIQRMMACKSEGHAQAAGIFFAVVNYPLQVWPWIITGLGSLVILGPLPDPELGYPMLMGRLLPAGLLGLLVAALLGAFMSTVDTHLNLGAAYAVNDIYRRFLRPEAPARHYVRVSRLTMLVLLGISVVIALNMDSVGDAYRFLVAFVGGAGLVWILRWFWWRVNAWSEISAMLASGLITIGLSALTPQMPYTQVLLRVALGSAAVWIPVTFLTPPADPEVLRVFLERVRSGSVGWRAVYHRLGIRPVPYFRAALVDWGAGVGIFFGVNFGVGHLIFGRALAGEALLAGAALASWWLYLRIRRRQGG